MTSLPIRGNQRAVGISILAGAVLIAAGVYLPTSISIFGGGIKPACEQWKKDIKEYTETNPVITGNYSDFNDPVFQEWTKKGDDINKRLFDSLGIKYHSIESWDTGNTTPNQFLNRTKENMTGMMEAMKRCYNAGVDFGGMKELKEFSKGLN
jgi:hypothetical protein